MAVNLDHFQDIVEVGWPQGKFVVLRIQMYATGAKVHYMHWVPTGSTFLIGSQFCPVPQAWSGVALKKSKKSGWKRLDIDAAGSDDLDEIMTNHGVEVTGVQFTEGPVQPPDLPLEPGGPTKFLRDDIPSRLPDPPGGSPSVNSQAMTFIAPTSPEFLSEDDDYPTLPGWTGFSALSGQSEFWELGEEQPRYRIVDSDGYVYLDNQSYPLSGISVEWSGSTNADQGDDGEEDEDEEEGGQAKTYKPVGWAAVNIPGMPQVGGQTRYPGLFVLLQRQRDIDDDEEGEEEE